MLRPSPLTLGCLVSLLATSLPALAQTAPPAPQPPAEPPAAEAPPTEPPPAEPPPAPDAEPKPDAPDGGAAPNPDAAPAPEQPPGGEAGETTPSQPAPAPDASAPPGPGEPAAPPQPPAATAPVAPVAPVVPAPAAQPQPPPPAAETPAPAPVPPPTQPWSGQPTTPMDSGVLDDADGQAQKPIKSRWRLSRLLLDQSVTTETLGVGQDVQSRNPTYDWTLQALPRYYFIDRDSWSWAVLGNVSIAQELTNSDSTSERREVDFNDSTIALRYDRVFYKADGYRTGMGFIVPELVLPTSKASRNSGRRLGLAASIIPSQVLPLSDGPFFETLVVAPLARYQHYFTEATVPTNNELARPRTDLGGRPVLSDQLSGSAFAKHETRFGFVMELGIHERVVLATDVQWRPTWNYAIAEETEVCLATGCVQVEGSEDAETFEVVTAFATEVAVQVMDPLSITLGYLNIANQIGPDGQRRSMFYSPNARFYLTATAYLDQIFDKQDGARVTRSSTARATGSVQDF